MNGSAPWWHTRHGRGLRWKALEQLASKPGGCGLMPPPPRRPLVAWQVAQSRSVWQATQALRLRWASQAWCWALRGPVVHTCGGGWKRRPASRLPLGESRPTPTRRWQSPQKVCSWWQLTQRGVVLTRALGVHRDPVVGVHVARPDPSVVTVHAELALVAAGAHRAVGTRHALVARQPIRRVGRPRGATSVAAAAPWRRWSASRRRDRPGGSWCSRRGRHPSSARASRGSRSSPPSAELLTGGELELLDHAVALRALDVAVEVRPCGSSEGSARAPPSWLHVHPRRRLRPGGRSRTGRSLRWCRRRRDRGWSGRCRGSCRRWRPARASNDRWLAGCRKPPRGTPCRSA